MALYASALSTYVSVCPSPLRLVTIEDDRTIVLKATLKGIINPDVTETVDVLCKKNFKGIKEVVGIRTLLLRLVIMGPLSFVACAVWHRR